MSNLRSIYNISKPLRVGVPFLVLVLCASSLPAQTGTLFVEGDNVGIGTAIPAFKLDIAGTDGSTRVQVINTGANAARTLFKLANNGFPRFVLEDTATSSQWLMAIAGGGNFIFGKVGTGVNEFVVEGGGNLTIAGEMTATLYNTSSSQDLKQGFSAVDGREVLERLDELEITEWAFKDDHTGSRHIGPVAQDFHAAFGLGDSDEHIGLMDAAGVTMAAVQGLHELVQERDAEIAELQRQNAMMAEELAALKQVVQTLLDE